MSSEILPQRTQRTQRRRNPKYEARNPKQIRIPNAQMFKTKRNRGLRGFPRIKQPRRHQGTKGTTEKEGGIGVSEEQEVGIRGPGDRKQIARNPKHYPPERRRTRIRNPKQIRISKAKNSKQTATSEYRSRKWQRRRTKNRPL